MQARLSGRISSSKHQSTHTSTRPLSRLEPAAHLDPGPKGYDIYGHVGYSLYLVPKLFLDKDEVTKRVEKLCNTVVDSDKLTSQHLLLECRRLFQRYSAGVCHCSHDTSATLRVHSANTETMALSVLEPDQLPLLVSTYEKAIQFLLTSKETDLALQAMNELGDVMMLSNNTRWVWYGAWPCFLGVNWCVQVC